MTFDSNMQGVRYEITEHVKTVQKGSILVPISSDIVSDSSFFLVLLILQLFDKTTPFLNPTLLELLLYRCSSSGHPLSHPVAFNLCSASPLHPVCRLPATDKVSWQPAPGPSFAELSGNPGNRVRATLLEQ